jgi:hypothetical protein
MTVRKAIVCTLITPVVGFVMFLMEGGRDFSIVYIPLGIGFWIVGLALGAILSGIFQSPPKEPWLYIIVQALIIVTFITLTLLDYRGD